MPRSAPRPMIFPTAPEVRPPTTPSHVQPTPRPAAGALVDARSLSRFVVVGVSNAAITTAVFWLLLHALPHARDRYAFAQTASALPGVAWSYFWNRRWAFESAGSHRMLLWRFVASQVVLAVGSGLVLQRFATHTTLPEGVSWAIVSLTTTLANYLVLRRLVFPHAGDGGPAPPVAAHAE